MFFLLQLFEFYTMPILQIGKLKLVEVKKLAQVCPAKIDSKYGLALSLKLLPVATKL